MAVDGFRDALHHALRRLLRRPGSTTAMVLILAMGIGVSTAAFSVVRRVLVRPIPVRDLDRLAVAWEVEPSEAGSLIEVSYPYFQRSEEHTSELQSQSISYAVFC